MTKKIIVLCAAVALLFAGCKNKSTEPMSNGMPKAGQTTASTAGGAVSPATIAYVDVDTLMTKLEMCKDGLADLEAKSATYQKEIQNKAAALQKAYTDHAKKMQTTGYPSQAEYESAEKRLQNLQQEGANLEMKYGQQLQEQQDAFNKKLHDAVQEYLATFNADKRYSMILAKSGDNVLYADPALDITAAIVEGMNAAYKKQ